MTRKGSPLSTLSPVIPSSAPGLRSQRDNKVTAVPIWWPRRMGIKTDPSALFDIQIKRDPRNTRRQLINIIEEQFCNSMIRCGSHPGTRLDAKGEIPSPARRAAEFINASFDHQARQYGSSDSTMIRPWRGLLKNRFQSRNYNVFTGRNHCAGPPICPNRYPPQAMGRHPGTGNMKICL